MSPELWKMFTYNDRFGEFEPEKSDIFSLGLTFLRVSLIINELILVEWMILNKDIIKFNYL